MLTSRISSKGQVTLPKKVRDELSVHTGDTLVYEVQGNVVTVRKVEPFDTGWHEALSSTLSEWSSPEDDEAYSDL
jgi:antitoxin PrlF